MIPNEDKEKRFLRWHNWILAKIGFADSNVLRYLWDLYDELIEQIKSDLVCFDDIFYNTKNGTKKISKNVFLNIKKFLRL